MQLTAIIANRLELPENLSRTIEGIKDQGVSVLVIEDPENDIKGCGWRRHEGIMSLDDDTAVFLCDGHMRFSKGYFNRIKKELEKTPDQMLCTRMHSMNHDWSNTGQDYFAAKIKLFDTWEHEQHIPIAAKWTCSRPELGPVGAVMGACYAFTVKAYKQVGQPLSILRAWGGDEEILSVAFWLAGGGVRLIAGTCWHIYNAPRQGGRKPPDAAEVSRVWGNRLAILDAIPMPVEEREALRAWMYKTPHVAPDTADRPEIETLQAALEAGSMSWDDYKRNWISDAPQEKKPEKKEPEPSDTGRANYGANENRRTCHKCGSPDSYVHTTNRTARLIIRYRTCRKCGTNRATQEFIPTA